MNVSFRWSSGGGTSAEDFGEITDLHYAVLAPLNTLARFFAFVLTLINRMRKKVKLLIRRIS